MSERRRIPLDVALETIARLRTTFDTLDYFPHNDPMRSELLTIAEHNRTELSSHLANVAAELSAHPERFAGDFEEMREYAIDIAIRGFPGRSLDSMMRTSAFGDEMFRLDLPPGIDAATSRAMRPSDFIAALIQMLRNRVNERATIGDKSAFDRLVFQPYLALMFVIFATTD